MSTSGWKNEDKVLYAGSGKTGTNTTPIFSNVFNIETDITYIPTTIVFNLLVKETSGTGGCDVSILSSSNGSNYGDIYVPNLSSLYKVTLANADILTSTGFPFTIQVPTIAKYFKVKFQGELDADVFTFQAAVVGIHIQQGTIYS